MAIWVFRPSEGILAPCACCVGCVGLRSLFLVVLRCVGTQICWRIAFSLVVALCVCVLAFLSMRPFQRAPCTCKLLNVVLLEHLYIFVSIWNSLEGEFYLHDGLHSRIDWRGWTTSDQRRETQRVQRTSCIGWVGETLQDGCDSVCVTQF